MQDKQTHTPLGPAAAFGLLCLVAVSWGLTWPVNKAILSYAPPIWAVALRYVLATLFMLPITWSLGRLRFPPRHDIPVVLSIGSLHMVMFGVLCSFGLLYVSAGRSVLVAYTTPLWVFPFARIVLGEPLTASRLAALALGLSGLAILVNPLALDWADRNVLIGHGLILLAAILWASSIVYARLHKWTSSPFDLLIWQCGFACLVLCPFAFLVEGPLVMQVDGHLVFLLVFSSAIGTVLPFWALNTVNQSLPATTTAIGLLGVPVIGVLSSFAFGERATVATVLAMVLIVTGISIGALGGRKR